MTGKHVSHKCGNCCTTTETEANNLFTGISLFCVVFFCFPYGKQTVHSHIEPTQHCLYFIRFHSPKLHLLYIPWIYHEHIPEYPTSAWIHGFILHNCNGLCEMTWVEWACGASLSWPKCFFFNLGFVFCISWVYPRTICPPWRKISWIFLKWIKKNYIV